MTDLAVLEREIIESVPEPEPLPMETDEGLYEILDGKRVEKPPMSKRSMRIGNRLGGEMMIHVTENPIGEVLIEGLFEIPIASDPGRNRRPDIAFVSSERLQAESPEDAPGWDVVPDLAVEVVSPSDRAEEQLEKVLEYFEAGVRLVWVLFPRLRLVYIYDSPTRVRILTKEDVLDGSPVLPEFRLPLAGLFDPVPPKPRV